MQTNPEDKWMAKVLSIEIGTTLTEIVEIDYKVRNPKVYKSLMISTPEGVLDEGMLYGYENFAMALKKMLKAKGFKARKAIFSVSSNRIASREVEIPYIKENQIRDFVLANASDYFPVDITEYIISYIVLENLENDNGMKAIRINALAMPSEILESYRDFAKLSGLELEAIDYDGNSLYQAVKKECGVGSQIVIKIDEKSSIVTVMNNGIQSLTRTVPYGIEEAIDTIIYSHIYSDNTSHSEAISYLRTVKCINPAFDMEAYRRSKAEERIREEKERQERDNEQTENIEISNSKKDGIETDSIEADSIETDSIEKYNIETDNEGIEIAEIERIDTENKAIGSEEEIENPDDTSSTKQIETKEEIASGIIIDDEEDISPELRELRENVTFSFENLVSGLSTVLDLYYSRSKGQKVDRVVITGIGGTLQGIEEIISNTLDVPANSITSLEGIQFGKVFRNGLCGEYIGCIGAAIKPVDFLITGKSSDKKDIDIQNVAIIVFVGCLAISAALTAASVIPYIKAKKTNTSLKNQVLSQGSSVSIYREYTLAKQENEFLQNVYSLAEVPNDNLVAFIEEMEEKMPSSLIVTTFSSDANSVSMSITVNTKEEAAETIEQFRTFESLEDVSVDSISDTYTPDNVHLVSFSLTATYAEDTGTSDEEVDDETLSDEDLTKPIPEDTDTT